MCAQGGGKEGICLVKLFLWMQWCLCIEVVISGNFSNFKFTFFLFLNSNCHPTKLSPLLSITPLPQ